MNNYLLSHTAFAIWALVFLVVGMMVSWAWAISFRRLVKAEINPRELRWEAWRGVLGAGCWIVSLVLVFLVMVSTYDIASCEAVGVSEAVSSTFKASIEAERSLILFPAILTLSLALGTLLLASIWSGALAVMRAKGEQNV